MTDYDRSLLEGLRRDIRNAGSGSHESSYTICTAPKGAFDVIVIVGFTIVIIKLLAKLVAAIAVLM